MALIPDVLSIASATAGLAIVVVWLFYYIIAVRVDEHIRVTKIGNYGIKVDSWLPFGFDFVYRSINATIKHKNLELWRKLFGAGSSYTLEARVMGKRVVFTADPENIKALLTTQFDDYGKGEPFRKEWHPFLGDSIFTTDGDDWHNSRKWLRPQFIRDRVSDLHCFESHIQTLFKMIAYGGPLRGEGADVDMHAGHGKLLEANDLLLRYTLDVATEFLLGKDVRSMTTPRNDFAKAFAEVQRVHNIISRVGFLKHMIPLVFRSYHRSLRVIDDFINPYIEAALQLSQADIASKSKSSMEFTFLHELASHTRDPRAIRDQLVAVLLAGRDTTAATLSWTIYELGKAPTAMARLRQEILDVIGLHRPPTFDDLKSMRYLQNRMSLRDTTLPHGGGSDGTLPLAVLKDTPIGYSTLLMQRRDELYPPLSADSPDPQRFAPERWYTWQPKPWLYVPFNGGPRICLGQQFALTEMGYTLVRIFQRYERVVTFMDEVNGGNPRLKCEIVLQPADGVRCAFFEVEKAA